MTQQNLELVMKALDTVQEAGIGEDELRQAKSKIGSRVVRGNERPMGRMQAVGMTWTYLHQYRTVDEELQEFEAVDLKAIRNVLDAHPINRVTTYALGPLQCLKPVR
jgi:predicted Zn-dependent peptidase